MRLASKNDGSRDGELVVVSKDHARYLSARRVAPSLQAALDDWHAVEAGLAALQAELDVAGSGAPLDSRQLTAPLARAYAWLDASAYLRHVELARRARAAELPPKFFDEPLMYQGESGCLLGPYADVPVIDVGFGLDFEAELCIILDDVPRGILPESALSHIRLFTLANDWTYRNLVPDELGKGLGFVVSKPATAFGPLALTPDELGPSFREGRVQLRLCSWLNGELVGQPHAGKEMHFSFAELVAHAASTRRLTAGTLLGSGTVSSAEPGAGVSCLVEKRSLELLASGKASTEYLKPGDTVRIEMFDAAGASLFGAIEQKVV